MSVASSAIFTINATADAVSPKVAKALRFSALRMINGLLRQIGSGVAVALPNTHAVCDRWKWRNGRSREIRWRR